MAPSPSQPPGNPLVWLLLTNAVFLGGLFGGESLLRQVVQRPEPGLSSSLAEGPLPEAPLAGGLLAERVPVKGVPLKGTPAVEQALGGRVAAKLLAEPDAAFQIQPASGEPGVSLIGALGGADALGGEVNLASLAEPRMLPAARAEQLSWQRSGDPLSPLPLHWRNRLRLETAGGPPIQQARLVHLPVAQLQEREEVAVLIDDSGTAQGLNEPRQQPTREAVEAWASRQLPAQAGSLQAVVIAAEPLISPAPAPAAPVGP